MAIKHVTVDDLDGAEGAKTRHFGLEGINYEIDLTDQNAEKMFRDFQKYVEAARRSTGKAPKRVVRTAPSHSAPADIDKSQADHMKAWAKKQDQNGIRTFAKSRGIAVSERGRIPLEAIAAAYNEAHAPGKSDPAPLFSAV